ncbi:hypothetical protein P0082_05745 [Candidatus Haliotispira prima]|uniref:Uncharacterized protein n=1 Tax=Candidatus Haliotispira prima TaxID=3034016 RepID=A0ABY8MME2_9SPIO|nr:hypothetical protein P0082_05745 [Candidatus Haliotispira prima]
MADKQAMRKKLNLAKRIAFCAASLLVVGSLLSVRNPGLEAYRYAYAEQYYKLYRRNLYHYPEDIMGNINYLLAARSSPFVNPLNALAKIEDEKDWKYYQALFVMHVNLLLVKEHMNLADRFDKYNAYFYNAPWKKSNLDSLDKAESYYRMALSFWPEVLRWAQEAGKPEYRWLEPHGVAAWMTELANINDKTIDYQAIIRRDLDRLVQVRTRFQAMDENTY